MMRLPVIFLFLAVPVLSAQTIQVNKDNRTIAITATDSAEAMADSAIVSIGFEQTGVAQDQVYAAASKISNGIIDALKASGVAPAQIESEEQGLSPISPDDRQRYATGQRFLFSQTWRVTCKAMDAANVLHLAVTAGANKSGGITWSLADDNALDGEAAEKALAHAQQIAQRMAAGLHAQLGALIYASNQVPERPIFGLANTPRILALRSKEIKPLALSPDKITRSATVYAVFSIQ